MADMVPFDNGEFTKKSFWSKPEGVTGAVFLLAFLALAGYGIATNIDVIIGLFTGTISPVSYTHLRSPRDVEESRMPSSA